MKANTPSERQLTPEMRDVISRMGERFTSGNSVPVERANITRAEWTVILELIDRLLP